MSTTRNIIEGIKNVSSEVATKANPVFTGDSIAIPVGTTAQRPSSPTSGMIRMNSTTGIPEWYDQPQTTWRAFSDSSYVIEMFAWGGGGAGGYSAGAGGGGGYAAGVMRVSSLDQFAIVIGGGGLTRAGGAGTGTPALGGGGLVGNLGYGGNGGGYSGIFNISSIQNNAILIAGGGGGASWEARNGGAGGGTNGEAGANGSSAGGGGGTQLSGGTSVSGIGSALQGGSAGSHGDSGGAGGGGGGYFGGGAGGSDSTGSAGGGGSGFVHPYVLLSASLTAGSGTTPGNSTDPLRGNYGNGGATGANNGIQGVFIIRYSGSQRGLGGTITSSGGYTYHTFTSANTFTA